MSSGSQTGMFPARLSVKMAAISEAGSSLACSGLISAVTPSSSVSPVRISGRGQLRNQAASGKQRSADD